MKYRLDSEQRRALNSARAWFRPVLARERAMVSPSMRPHAEPIRRLREPMRAFPVRSLERMAGRPFVKTHSILARAGHPVDVVGRLTAAHAPNVVDVRLTAAMSNAPARCDRRDCHRLEASGLLQTVGATNEVDASGDLVTVEWTKNARPFGRQHSRVRLATIDSGGLQIALVVGEADRLLGIAHGRRRAARHVAGRQARRRRRPRHEPEAAHGRAGHAARGGPRADGTASAFIRSRW